MQEPGISIRPIVFVCTLSKQSSQMGGSGLNKCTLVTSERIRWDKSAERKFLFTRRLPHVSCSRPGLPLAHSRQLKRIMDTALIGAHLVLKLLQNLGKKLGRNGQPIKYGKN